MSDAIGLNVKDFNGDMGSSTVEFTGFSAGGRSSRLPSTVDTVFVKEASRSTSMLN
ncbi:hypothetical protein HanRHA438_Chr13g0593611 [Helianthus annuus]|nr:hypothetical protein HanRHA438_Chr13g0593611 [Helianthus annuus]